MIQVLKEPIKYPENITFSDTDTILEFDDGTTFISPLPFKNTNTNFSPYVSITTTSPLQFNSYQEKGIVYINGLIKEASELNSGIVTTDEQVFSGKKKFIDGLVINAHTTAYWEEHYDYIPENGEIIIYTDHKQKNVTITNPDGSTSQVTMNIPGIKIGGGSAYAIDQPFIGEDMSEQLIEHITNSAIHVSEADRLKWDNKIEVSEISTNEELVIFYK